MAGVYDPKRNVYYFTDVTKIQVLSLANGGWQTPITIPNLGPSPRLFGIAISPDASELAVSDFGDDAIYLLNPDSPASAQKFQVDQSFGHQNNAPTGLAIANSGAIYYSAVFTGGGGTLALHKLDVTTGNVTDLGPFQDEPTDIDLRILRNPDGSIIYSQMEGISFEVNPATDAVSEALNIVSSSSGGNSEISISADGSTLITNNYMTDASLNPFSQQVYIDWETFLPVAVFGQKLNHDGSLLFQPLLDGIDVVDVQTGRLLHRVQVPTQLANVFDVLTTNNNDNFVLAITSTGVEVIDLEGLSQVPAGSQIRRALGTTRRHQTTARSKVIPGRKTNPLRGPQLLRFGAPPSNGSGHW
jgi:DNA-binding beta-propeller fold protein YncE